MRNYLISEAIGDIAGSAYEGKAFKYVGRSDDPLAAERQAITARQVVRFSYQRFGQEPFELTFHPQFLKEYNGRWFVFQSLREQIKEIVKQQIEAYSHD